MIARRTFTAGALTAMLLVGTGGLWPDANALPPAGREAGHSRIGPQATQLFGFGNPGGLVKDLSIASELRPQVFRTFA